MRHRNSGRKLNLTSSHRKAMLSNMVTSLFAHERIETTLPRAKELRGVAERLITIAKEGTLHARRVCAETVRDPAVLRDLFDRIAPAMKDRAGGYTRVIRLQSRRGDAASMAKIELVTAAEATDEAAVAAAPAAGTEAPAETPASV